MCSCGPLHTDEQVLNDQLEHIYSSSVLMQDVAWKTSRGRWTIETGDEIFLTTPYKFAIPLPIINNLLSFSFNAIFQTFNYFFNEFVMTESLLSPPRLF